MSPSTPNQRIFISSTYGDPSEYEDIISNVITQHGFHPVTMENPGTIHILAMLDISLRLVRQSDVFIGIIGQRYGQSPETLLNPRRLSILEMQYDEAIRHSLPTLMFVKDVDYPVTEAELNFDPDSQKKLSDFKAKVTRSNKAIIFTDLHDFLLKANQAIARLAGDYQSSSHDEIINHLRDGNDVQRRLLLDQLIRGEEQDWKGLAERLRRSIRDECGPQQQVQLGTKFERERIASARGWLLSCLIWLDPISKESASLIVDHLNSDWEPERHVRFWTLTGIIQRKPPYLEHALELGNLDDAPEINYLARAAATPHSETLLIEFSEVLKTQQFEEAWPVLRVLRVLPLPSLGADVVAILRNQKASKGLIYGALTALATPEMIQATRQLLFQDPGLETLCELILRQARSAKETAIPSFARVLSGFDPDQVRRALHLIASPRDASLVRLVIAASAPGEQAEQNAKPIIAGYASDTINIAHDDIGIHRDVETLSSIILARDVVPPLAIGLFGEWGAGKSFFMRSITYAVERLAARAKSSSSEQFCAEVVQIHFNAWHYVDTNLWASLVSHILDGLSGHLTPSSDPASTQASLAHELASVREEIALAETDCKVATEQLLESSKALQVTIVEREHRELKLRDLRAEDLVAILGRDKTLKAKLETALNDVGAPIVLDSIDELNRVIDDSYSMANRFTAFFLSLFKRDNVWIVVCGILMLLVVPPLVDLVIRKCINADAATLSAVATQISVVVGAVSLTMRKALGHVKSALNTLTEARANVMEQIKLKRSSPSPEEIKLQHQVAEAKAQEQAATERLSAASARAKVLEDRVAYIRQSQSLGYFVSERMQSDDYRRHLGLISIIRKDFEELVTRLRNGQPGGSKTVDRIVLYIDDVDRCPPAIVVDILQAVHLLLAYELFVVVVSVDPRWLLRSLETKFAHLKADEFDTDAASATSQDYLEKIFQIPFSVRPMNDTAFGKMMRRYLAPKAPKPGESERVFQFPLLGELTRETSESLVGGTRRSAVELEDFGEPRELEVLATALTISEAEADFAETLHAFLVTPRSSKRFANVYRLLKASINDHESEAYEGTSVESDEFRLPMLLLAALVGDAKSAAILFPQFLSGAESSRSSWWTFTDPTIRESPAVSRLRISIASMCERSSFPKNPAQAIKWLPRVGRFSFLTAKIFIEAR